MSTGKDHRRYNTVSNKLADRCLVYLMDRLRVSIQSPENIQYCNFTHVREMFFVNQLILQHLDKNKTHINIGTGVGFMEHVNNKNKFVNLKTADLDRGIIDPMFKYGQNLLGVKQNYNIKHIRKNDGSDLKITGVDPFTEYTRWDNAIFNRFVPFHRILTNKENVIKFNKNMKKYVDNITIISLGEVKSKKFVPTQLDTELFPNAKFTELGHGYGIKENPLRVLMEYSI